jgi:hypothetical protein
MSTDRKPEIVPVILPEGYNGKILSISVTAARVGKRVVLRSGDLWHREILRNTENEISALGIDAQVHPLGGALLRFEPDGSIIISGSSHEFGSCDKAYAARLVQEAFPASRVEVRK